MSVWFVTGSSRGFGAEIVRAALAEGHQVAATARDAEAVRAAFPEVLALPMDVTDATQVNAAVEATVARFGRIDVVVNNAAYGLLSAVEEASDEATRAVYETNVFGVLNVLRAVLPVLRGQRSGHVINISSVAGFASSPGWGIYASTKFAMEGYSEALAQELAPLGVHVTIVEPGYFRTDFLQASSLTTEQTVFDDYATTSGAMRTLAVQVNGSQPGDPVRGAQAVVRLAGAAKPPLRLPLGSDCVRAIESKLDSVAGELAEWRAVAVGADFAASA